MVDRPDRELVAAATAGDRAAFAAIYDRYADRVFGLCLSLLHHRDDAADAAQDTFVRAAERLEQLRDPDKLRAWLLAIARNESLLRSRRRQRTEPSGEEIVVPVDDTAAASAIDAELAALVWDAAEGLDDRDRVLLELHVRQGLEGAELADAIGVKADHGYVLAQRMRERVERSLGALLVARLGREDCDDLRTLLGDWDGRFSVAVRKRVSRHVTRCEVCEERRASLVSPAALFASIPLIPPPAALRDRVLGRVDLTSSVRPGPRADGWSDGFPPALDLAGEGRRRPLALWSATIAAAILLVVGVIAGWAALRGDVDATGIETVGGPASTSGTPGTPASTAPPTSEPGILTTLPDAVESTGSVLDATAASGAGDPTGAAPVPGTTIAPAPPPAGDAGRRAPAPTAEPPAPSPPPAGSPAPATAAPPTTTAPPPPGAAPPPAGTPPPTTSAPPPTTVAPLPVLVVSPRAVTLSPANPSTGVRLTNRGPTTARWAATATDGRISVSPAGGTLAPGSTASITVAVDGRALATGVTIGGAVAFGGGRAQVVLAVSASGPPLTTTTLGFDIVTTTTGRGLVTGGR